ncbi:hypothetical protein [Sulfurirhabdus autotrophica]|uniref:O-antigen ligase-like membrane protein n=1 Tax=Sulfurirhabdus autotrophica TaxID=1706046 RepID=A0A4R3XWT1_9PROT|nr:hypothetical protein [Sulfurirhabdus autotrophica]TCV83437.1 hypothetical protein EDC63_11562 [Sulfurirhabdus autotrophica]
MNQAVQADGMVLKGDAFQATRMPAPSLLLFMMLAVIFVLFNTVFQTFSLPSVPLVGGANMFIQDLLLWLLVFFGMFAKLNNSKTSVGSSLSKFVAFFMIIIVAEVLYAVVAFDRPLFRVYNDSKDFYYYMLFFPVIWCFGNDKGISWIIKLWAVLAFFGALLFLYQFFFGELDIFQKYTWLYSSSLDVSTGGTGTATLDYKRLLSQGTVLFRIMLFVAFCMWLFPTGRNRQWWGWLALILALQVLLQFTRGMYVTTLLALLLMPLLISESAAKAKIRNILVLSVIVITLAIAYKAIYATTSSNYGLFEFIGERFFRGVTEAGQDSSLKGRVDSAEYLFSKMDGNWLFGLGFGSGLVYGDSTIVSLLVKTGLVGTVAFFVMFIQACLNALRRFRFIDNPVQKALMLALLVSTMRHLVNGITQSDFALDTRIAALIVSVAMMEIIGIRALAARKANSIQNEQKHD